MKLLNKLSDYFKSNGFIATIYKIIDYLRYLFRIPKTRRLQKKYMEAIIPNNEVLEKQRQKQFSKNIMFSILVPLYNTPIEFLKEMTSSVLNQTYNNWELCLADGSDNEHNYVGDYCKALSLEDDRIVYKKLLKNEGIAENTNRCIEIATGDFLVLFDHDDLLHPSVLYKYMEVIESRNADMIYTDELTFKKKLTNIITFHFKPDFAPDTLRANNYICHVTTFSRKLLGKVGMFRKEFDGSQDHDFILRLTENAENIVHIPELLYFWRSHPNSVSSDINAKIYAIESAKKAVKSHLKRQKLDATIKSSRAFPTIFNIEYSLKEKPLISIIIPTKDNVKDLKKCINSIYNSSYTNFEIIVIDNQSTSPNVKEYYKQLGHKKKIKLLYWDHSFNYSEINNHAVTETKGEHLIFLNNDTEVITKDWIEQMLMYSQREDVGAVGAKLYYANRTIQHAGIIIGLGEDGVAGHAFHGMNGRDIGYMGRLCYAQNYSAVTAACMMIKKTVFEEVGGFDEKFAVAYNDVDLCLKIRAKNYLNVWTPLAELYHYESKTRGYENESKEKQERFKKEVAFFKERWSGAVDKGDSYYNKNLTLKYGDFRRND